MTVGCPNLWDLSADLGHASIEPAFIDGLTWINFYCGETRVTQLPDSLLAVVFEQSSLTVDVRADNEDIITACIQDLFNAIDRTGFPLASFVYSNT